MAIRKESEIQDAHDRLAGIVLGEAPWPFPPDASNDTVIAALDVLCWVLNHEHNQSFANNLIEIDAVLRQQGFVLGEAPRAHS
jgi:hypothetical protein